MPVISFHNLPLPSLRVYVAFSLAVVCFYFCFYLSLSWSKPPILSILELLTSFNYSFPFFNNPFLYFDVSAVNHMIQDTVGFWVVINTFCCLIMVLGKCIQRMVFGNLRVSEIQHFKDKLWNFTFYKFIFVFGVINVQYMEEALLWLAWFTVIGSLHLLAQLTKDRFEYLSFSVNYAARGNLPLLCLFGVLLLSSIGMLILAIAAGMKFGLSLFAFLGAECILLIIFLLQTFSKYVIRCFKSRGNSSLRIWDERGVFTYYLDLFMDMSSLLVELLHHFHMLLGSNIFLSMASLVICLHIRYLIEEMRKKIQKHRNYLWVLHHMEQSYPSATQEELATVSDNCAICWDKLETARKLPCSHMFHDGCLLSWLQQDTSCPTCRLILRISNPASPNSFNYENDNNVNRGNHFFHFDGSRYISWLPSFSVEVIHTQVGRLSYQMEPNPNSQLDVMAHQVQQLFQDYPLSILIADLQITRSVEVTVGNILDGRLIHPGEESVVLENSQSLTQNSWTDIAYYEPENDNHSLDNQITENSNVFPDSPHERETLLNRRKELLLMTARNKYLHRQSDSTNASSPLG